MNEHFIEPIGVHAPSLLWRIGEKVLHWDIPPEALCRGHRLEKLYENYPFLRGDPSAIGIGDDGDCQSWKHNPGWWKDPVKDDRKLLLLFRRKAH